MSTVPEVIAAHQMGIKCLAISVIANSGVDVKANKSGHADISAMAEKALPKLEELLKKIIRAID